MTRSKAIVNQLLLAAPWVTIVVLIAMASALPNRTAGSAHTAERKAEIARAMDAVPLFIGRWVGEDKKEGIAKEAQRLLKPTTPPFNRRYTSPGGPWVHVLVVHCGDARDMIGHYPPICYPSAGWMAMPAPPNCDRVLNVVGRLLPVREYGFKGYLVNGREDVIRIFDAFILPDGTITREIDDINRQSERLSVAVQGVAQLQVITSGRISVEEAVSAAEEVLSGMNVLFDALETTVRSDGQRGQAAAQASPQGASS